MASEKIITVTEDNFEAEVIKSDKPTLVDFWAEWCGPCKMIAPVLDELAEELDGQARIGKVNIDEHAGLASKFNVMSIPTLLIFKNGDVVKQMVGVKGKGELKSALEQA